MLQKAYLMSSLSVCSVEMLERKTVHDEVCPHFSLVVYKLHAPKSASKGSVLKILSVVFSLLLIFAFYFKDFSLYLDSFYTVVSSSLEFNSIQLFF